jgi:hypothetical protein
MRENVSPLDGIRSPFGRRGGSAPGGGLVTSVTMGSVTFFFNKPVRAGLDQTFRAWVEDDGTGVIVTAISPAQGVDSLTRLINGAQKNPALAGTQGLDARLTSYNVASNAAVPISLVAGDRIIKAVSAAEATVDLVSGDGPFWRDGHIIEYATLHCVTAAPTATQVLRATSTWAGDTTPEVYDCNLDAIYAARTTYSAANITWPTYASLVATSGQYWPTRAYLNSQSQYEELGPRGFGGTAGAGGEVNFGQDMAITVGNLMLATTLSPSDPNCPYTESQIKDLMRRVLRNGIEWSLPWVYSGLSGEAPAGGIMQFDQGPGVLALDWIGLDAQKATFIDRVRGNWLQAFRISKANIADFAPHTNQFLPWFSRERTLPTQSGTSTQVTIEFDVDGYANGFDMQRDAGIGSGARLIRKSDGTRATLAQAVTVPNTSGAPTATFDLTAARPFSAGDVVTMIPAADTPLQAGTYEWTLRGYAGNERYAFSPGSGGYRAIQAWGGQILGLLAHGAWDSAFDRVRGYWELVQVVPNYPSATTNYTPQDDGIATAYIAENWQSSWSVLTVPEAMVVGEWAVNNGGVVTINTLPNNGGRFITGIDYRLNGGSWTAAPGVTEFTVAGGSITFTIPSYAGQNVELRTTNAIGSSAASDVKVGAAPPALSWTRIGLGRDSTATPSFTFDLSAFAAGDRILIFAGPNANDLVFSSLQGEAGSAAIASNTGGLAGRRHYIFEHTLVGAGSASAALNFTQTAAALGVEVYGIKGAVRDGANAATVGDTSFPTFSNITPSNANNVAICSVIGLQAAATVTFSNMTEQVDTTNTGSNIASAIQEDVALSPFGPTGSVSASYRKGGGFVVYSQA